MKPFLTTLSLIACIGAAGSAQAVAIVAGGDADVDLGPNLFVDQVVAGGNDVTVNEGSNTLSREDFADIAPLNVGPGGTQVSITGVAWFGPNWLNTDADEVSLTIRYLGADGVGGADDVVLGTVTDSYTFGGAAEYVWEFDSPITGVIDGANSFFRFEFTVTNDTGDGRFRMKTAAGLGIKMTVAGTSTAVSDLIPGDADGDGDVDDSDLGTAFSNYTGPLDPGTGGKALAEGDTDGDGDVDDSDLGTAFSNYTGPLSAAVPEPASLSLLALGGLFAARRRRA